MELALPNLITAGVIGLASSWALVQAIKWDVSEDLVFAGGVLTVAVVLGILGILDPLGVRSVVTATMGYVFGRGTRKRQ